jgi:arginyl-tRNA synthetase
MSLADRVRVALLSALGTTGLRELAANAAWTIERPKRAEHGDLATNVAMALAKRAGKPPRALAEQLVAALAESDVVASAEVAGPGFVNLRLHPAVYHAELGDILRAGGAWGRSPAATGERIDIEFVSANPTGPVTVASGRNGVLGDTIARLLEATGSRVTREFYVNDRGNQVRLFAESVKAADAGREPPEQGYKGSYVAELAAWLRKNDPKLLDGADVEALGRTCVTLMLRGLPGSRTLPGIRPSLAALRISFDVWFSEESLHRWGAVDAVVRQLQETGFLFEKDGALFFKAPEGALDEKDRVVRKSDGSYAYFASDIAYFADKISRGYDRLLLVLGADHGSYPVRVRNALSALGLPEERFEAISYQLVFVVKGGEQVKSSKREGKFVAVHDVMDEIDAGTGRAGAGADALRFFFLSRSANTSVDFDVDLAQKASLDNPVFYVQYGHARLCSILRNAAALGLGPGTDFTKLVHPDELAILHKLGDFPDVVSESARLREPHRVVFYLQELARDFQSYYTRLKTDPVLPPASVREQSGWQQQWDFGKTGARLAWVEAIQQVYASGLALVGVSAPERMDRPAEENDETDGGEADAT